ncbi:helix-turn-helix domain-containing protein [Lishizhenia sp.]|uniref:TetR/AcrR family transcriptional regulator n=1 Tax=Lishizhenia sp. TaxID=2497594 RepID=UPI00299EF275|nr:helix-turn-helix domain-containing protein [Lishizhenia sp.]MDX1446642.1 helix-turn-helix domain-containing protein [Lishizhenia sp.]
MRDYSAKNESAFNEKRSDASANRNTIIRVAHDLFALKGPEVSMSVIAREAKVSRATLYRNFEDKGSLVLALMHYNLKILEDYADTLAHDENEFRLLLMKAAEFQYRYQGLLPFLPQRATHLNERLIQLVQGPIERAIKRGEVAPSYEVLNDTVLLIRMLGSVVLPSAILDSKASMNRAWEMLLKGLGAID